MAIATATAGTVAAQGLRAGDFLLSPTIALQGSFNDNIYLAPGGNKTDDYVMKIKPALDIKSQFDRHALNASISGEGARYSRDRNDYIDVTGSVDGRVDAWSGGSIFGLATFRRKHEDREESITSTTAYADQPVVYEHSTLNAGVQQVLGQWGGSISVRADRLSYKNARAVLGAPTGTFPLPTSDGFVQEGWRDRWEYAPSARVDFEFEPGMSIFVRGTYTDRRYDQDADPSGNRRSAKMYDAVVGMRVFKTGTMTGDVYAGWMTYNQDDSQAKTISTPKFGWEMEWAASPVLTVRTAASRSIEEVVQPESSAAIVTGATLGADYFVMPSLAVRPEIGVAHLDFKPFNGLASRTDWVYLASLGATYFINERFSVGPVYKYRHRNSDLDDNGYSQHIILLEAAAKL